MGDPVESEACTDLLLQGLFRVGAPVGGEMETATFNALEGKKENLLVSGEITNTSWNIVIWGQDCYKVRGKIVNADFGKK